MHIYADGEELILGLLHISGHDLHSLIQQERLRWSVSFLWPLSA